MMRITLLIGVMMLAAMALASRKADSVNLDASRTIETTYDGKVMHVNITDTTGKTKCTPAVFDKGFVVVCVER